MLAARYTDVEFSLHAPRFVMTPSSTPALFTYGFTSTIHESALTPCTTVVPRPFILTISIYVVITAAAVVAVVGYRKQVP